MAIFDDGAPRSSRLRDAVETLLDLPRATVLTAAAFSLFFGVFSQMHTGSVVVTCERRADALPACDLDRRVFFGAVPLGSRHVTGVQRARLIGHRGSSRRAPGEWYVVVLDTADGPREVGWSLDLGPAADLANTLNGRISDRTPRFEATLWPGLTDGVVRLFSNGCLVVGVGLLALVAFRRPWPTPPDAQSSAAVDQ